jgi:integrase
METHAMASVGKHRDKLYFDFRYLGQRCREYTALPDTPANRRKMEKVAKRLAEEISLGTFRYGDFFPGSKNAEKFSAGRARPKPVATDTPFFADYAETWFEQMKIGWRRSHTATIRSTLDRHLIPYFGEKEVGRIEKIDIKQFRSCLAKAKGRNGNTSLSAKTINRIIQILGQILSEAADDFDFNNPVLKIKRLKQQRVDIQPFTFEQVRLLLDTVREDFRPYLTVRFFTGMRTGELHGLKWKYVDFERRQILVRETWIRGECEYTKTDGSQREIDISEPVLEALQQQKAATGQLSEFVFCNREGEPLDTDNVTNRVWYPLLRHLGLEKRRPYQTRHTAATLWLAAGENPEWVAKQMGHTDTTMLFKVYSRYVPNLTRQDGSAFNNLINAALSGSVASETTHVSQ